MTKAIIMDPKDNVATLLSDVEEGDLDVKAGTIIEGRQYISDVGKHIYGKILSVVSGEPTKTESLGHKGPIAIYWTWPTPKRRHET